MDGYVLNLFNDHFLQSGDRTVCKFVLIRFGDETHLVFGPQDRYPYHASLVEQFCRRYEVASGWEHKPDLYEIFEAGCEILGGGYLDITPTRQQMAVYGSSTAYGAFPVAEFRQTAASGPIFAGYALTIQ